ncbi:MAG: uroporphyrinogen decarboxylase [Chloroflexi bacterium]|nr:uroporphyrinogen decarboxylase [Chloroflexota bacterium]
MTITHRQRLEACLAGELLDRPPVALWRHFPVDDQTGSGLAAATLAFQKTYDFDLVKVTSSSGYFVYDWGVQDAWRGNFEGTRESTHLAVNSPQDWENLPILDPQKGALGEQLAAFQAITSALGPDTPVIPTIFNPLSTAKKLAGQERLLEHLRQRPEELHKGLEIITESTRRFIEAAIATGIAGVFFAVQHAQKEVLTPQAYSEFGRAYDLPVLEAASPLWLNMLHLHGSQVMFDELADYPVSVINWHDLETEPSLSQALERFSGAVCGGLRQWDSMALGTPQQVHAEAQAAVKVTGGDRFILGTGCVTPIIAPHGNLIAARESVEI